ncbi:pilus assembly protein TadG-related protein [Nitratireductor sp. XY-223]|uniref:pilus assembly protein TadG-related protein n=1 Tax=Nitratireductor sp. XY-223 TaxID=2561926 RepID=UPI0010AA5BC5|nr:pilus assembly protein TadG-related protein [Nitratireductor sp. XY-223]
MVHYFPKRLLDRLRRDRSGNFIVMFALCVTVIFAAAGLALDYSVALMNKTRAANALDAATLATARAIVAGDISSDDDDEIETYLKSFFAANLGIDDLDASIFAIDSVVVDTGEQSVSATVVIDQPLRLLQVGTGRDTITVRNHSAANYGVGNVEVAMVLDVTGSMDDSVSLTDSTKKLAVLETAAKAAVETLLSAASDANSVRISLVPYSRAVNVGNYLVRYVYADHYYPTSDAPLYDPSLYNTTRVGYDWVSFQSGYASCPTSHNFDFQPTFRFAGGYGFGGGFSRGSTYGYDGYRFGDAWVFRAAEGGGGGGGGGNKGGGGGNKDATDCWDFVIESDGTSPDNCATDRKAPATAGNTSYQYADANPSYGMISRDARLEENECPDSPIIALTDTQDALETAIEGLIADGYTGGHIGLQWGWYTISHDWKNYMPAGSEPGDHTDPDADLKKYVIMMTDGLFNTAFADVEPDGFRQGKQQAQSIAHFDSLCTAIKNDDITIFTIGFAISTDPLLSQYQRDDALEALDDCATDDTTTTVYFYDVTTADGLTTAFEDIASTINALRLTR